MITYVNKVEFKATLGMATWQKLKFISEYDRLLFDRYHYNIGGVIYSKDTPTARDAFEKEIIWKNLSQKKRSNTEILIELASVAKEIDESNEKQREQKNRNLEAQARKRKMEESKSSLG